MNHNGVNLMPGPVARAACTVLVLILAAAGIRPAAADVLPSLKNVSFEETTSPAAPASGEPALTVGGGTAWMSWIENPEGGVPSVRFSRWEGTAWAPAKTIVSDKDLFVNWADFPGLLVLADGTVVASWLKKSGKDAYAYDVWIATSADDGVTWSAPLRPHNDGTQTEHGFVSLAPDPVEGFWAIWLDGRDYAVKGKEIPETQIRAALWREGKFGAEVVLDRRVCDCCQTAAVRTLEGMAVAYRDRGDDNVRDISVVRYERRVWEKPFTIRNDGWKIEGCPVNGPAMANMDRYLALAWFTDANEKPEVFLALSDSSSFGLSRIVKVDDGKPFGRVDVDWLPDETAIVVWAEEVGGGAEIRMRRVGLDGAMLDHRTLTPTSAGRNSGFPRLAVQGVNIWMAWTDVSAKPARVRVGRLDLTKAE